jgi:hypothetical protein
LNQSKPLLKGETLFFDDFSPALMHQIIIYCLRGKRYISLTGSFKDFIPSRFFPAPLIEKHPEFAG